MADFYKEKEHAFVTIEKDLKKGSIPKVVLLCGKEEYLVNWYADVIVKKYVNEACLPIDLVTLEGENLTLENITESLETVSLMSERKVVLLPDFAPAEGKESKWFRSSDVKALIEFFQSIPQGSMLLMTAGEPEDDKKKKNKLKAAVEKEGKVYDFQDLKGGQLKSFIEKRFRNAGKAYSSSVINTIIGESGYGNKSIEYSLYNLENDLKKIIAHSGAADEITAADVSDIISSNPENNVFAMLDAIGRNRKDEALRLLHNLLNAGTPIFRLLRMITNQLELILSVKELKEEGVALGGMQKTLGVHQFRIKKALAVTDRYSMEDLRNALSSAYEVDEHVKTGLMDGALALEYFVAKL